MDGDGGKRGGASARGSNALILAGAVARGAFEAGVLSELASAGIDFRCVVGTSAGALNAAVYGAGIATGRTSKAAALLEELWLERGSWTSFVTFSPLAWLRRQGLIETTRVEKLVATAIADVVGPTETVVERDVALELVTTDLHGVERRAPDGALHYLHEHAESFNGNQLREKGCWDNIARAAAASASFPGLFVPPIIKSRYRVDGGAVNNAPISLALSDPNVDRIFVVSTDPNKPEPPRRHIGGLELVGRLGDIVINERLSRDLLTARKTNDRLDRVKEAIVGLPREKQDEILAALRWRKIELIEIAPPKELPGTPFTGFFRSKNRQACVKAGHKAALDALKTVANVALV